MSRLPVWEYSKNNLLEMHDSFPNLVKFEIGYVSHLSRFIHDLPQDIDVLFYGSFNERRKNILAQLERAGLKIVYIFGKFSFGRDDFIKISKIIPNFQ